MRVVVDTNVLVSSFWGGNPKMVLDLWVSGNLILCVNQEILDEYFEVLSRLGLDQEEELQEILMFLKSRKNIEYCLGAEKKKFMKDDPDDDKFVNCAFELSAKVIVSGDKHLLMAKRVFDVEVLTPKQFLESFSK